jgi:hypothetical protein
MKEYRYMTLAQISKYEPELQALDVSEVARSPRGFLTYFKKIGGNPNNVNDFWRKKRHGFIARTLPPYLAHKTPRRRLSLIAWSYLPD